MKENCQYITIALRDFARTKVGKNMKEERILLFVKFWDGKNFHVFPIFPNCGKYHRKRPHNWAESRENESVLDRRYLFRVFSCYVITGYQFLDSPFQKILFARSNMKGDLANTINILA